MWVVTDLSFSVSILHLDDAKSFSLEFRVQIHLWAMRIVTVIQQPFLPSMSVFPFSMDKYTVSAVSRSVLVYPFLVLDVRVLPDATRVY